MGHTNFLVIGFRLCVLALGVAGFPLEGIAAEADLEDPLHRAAWIVPILIFLFGSAGLALVYVLAFAAVVGVIIHFVERDRPNRVDMRLAIGPGSAVIVALLLSVPTLVIVPLALFALVVTLAVMHYTDNGLRGFLSSGPIVCALALAPVLWFSTPGAFLAAGSAAARILPLPQGDPPYRTYYENHLTPLDRFVAARLRTPSHCLEKGADPGNRHDLLKMDWERIDNTAEAEVCIFRLMQALGGIGASRTFLEAQGFTVRRGPLNPRVQKKGFMIAAYWPIARNGPKFPTRGLVHRYFNAFPNAVTLTVNFDESGEAVLGVDINNSSW